MDWSKFGRTPRNLIVIATTAISALAVNGQVLRAPMGNSSMATIAVTLEKRGGDGPAIGAYHPQYGLLPVLLPDAVLNALLNNKSTRFPLCIVGASTNALKLDRLPGPVSARSIKNSSGVNIPYSVGVAVIPRSAQPQSGAAQCSSGSLVEVEVSIPKSKPEPQPALFGVIQLLLGTE